MTRRRADPAVVLLQAAGDPIRLAILRQLAVAGPVCACDIAAGHEVTQPTVSHHLRVLREAGWISGQRRGTWIWYAIRPEAARAFETIGRALAPPDHGPGRTLHILQPEGFGPAT
ncbi:MAG TPA: metalloregulator ArsR/SmtB family transcription factor [Candidatus Limnocylindrales bacterium]|nr:metalloregulator ArsR/SmtB family transcription factor [Candidatus Limnocylindrales bacterium]